MFQQFVDLGLNLFLFVIAMCSYVTGLKHGRELSKGNAPKLSLNPVKPILQAVERHKEEKKAKELGEELADVMSYSRESALEAVKREREVI